MRYQIQFGASPDARLLTADLVFENRFLRGTLDGRPLEAETVEIAPGIYSILVSGQSFEARVESGNLGLRIHINDVEFPVPLNVIDPRRWPGRSHQVGDTAGPQKIVAPMPGKVVKLLVQPGELVAENQGLLVVEAMKMQNEVRSPLPSRVAKLLVEEGQTVNSGDILAIIAPETPPHKDPP
jgi:biotin carboxyl carrier protein